MATNRTLERRRRMIVNGCQSGAARSIASLAIIVDANPDGAVAMTRTNPCGTDLNRDHLLVSEPETLALHSFVHRWQPDLVVDVHTYRPWQPAVDALRPAVSARRDDRFPHQSRGR